MPRDSNRMALRAKDFQFLRSCLRAAAMDYGPVKPAAGSAVYRAWVKRWGLRDMLKVFEAAHFDECAMWLRRVIGGEWPLTWAHLMKLEWHLREAHARSSSASQAEAGRKGARGRARNMTCWQPAVARAAERMWRGDPSLSASSVARELNDTGYLEELGIGESSVRQFLARAKKATQRADS